jgi:hypothetical protein
VDLIAPVTCTQNERCSIEPILPWLPVVLERIFVKGLLIYAPAFDLSRPLTTFIQKFVSKKALKKNISFCYTRPRLRIYSLSLLL